ncbi:ABC transporter permease [Pedobacter sp. MC2016-14]|uniref:ABC transporter permease n=1 Tax=Pedobacter sp. MC2016-14 TaxID=2897327 RepID=UPI001E56FA54|nr:ABC transporter permease [Pedobacter sp. MC2016-14]MCD0486604.1 ABC transporter permease [Pedobacter sp. MC2016-14]
MTYQENIRLAIQSIRSNRLRTLLTALIIAIGLSALVGILTTLDAVKKSMTETFSSMGSNSFTIRNRGTGIRIGGSGQKPKSFTSIKYTDAIRLKDSLPQAIVAVSVTASNGATVKYEKEKTNPNIKVVGIDENGLSSQSLELALGRNFSKTEAGQEQNACIIGHEISNTLFNGDDPIGKIISVGPHRLKVIGVLKLKGSSMGANVDRSVYITLLKGKRINSFADPSYTISISVSDNSHMDNTIGDAIAEFRTIRKLKVTQANNFEIAKSDAVAQTLIENSKYVAWGGIAIGVITLIGASIGLMNIMLVSVTERTREIGVRKAIGANPAVIRKQFLIEAVVICMIGGSIGIFFGLLLGNVISFFMGGTFIIPWMFIIGGFILCVMVGVLSGYYPAKKASKLDPVEALRYE